MLQQQFEQRLHVLQCSKVHAMSREIPYSPMGTRKEVSYEQMTQVLDKHAQRLKAGETAKQDSDELKTTRSDQPSAVGLVWSEPKKGLGFVYIDAGPYRITRQNKKYECHRECYYLGTRTNAEDAKQLCAADFAAQAQPVTA